MTRAPIRVLALMPAVEAGLRVTPAATLSALDHRFELRFEVPQRGDSIESLLLRGFGTEETHWIALPDHDQAILPSGIDRCSIPGLVWIDDAYVAPVERLRWLHAVRPRLALFTQRRWARFYRDALLDPPLWLPHGIDPRVFHPPSTRGGRDIDVLLFGRIDPRVYPFRTRLARLLSRLGGANVCVLEHPGYGGEIPPERALADLLRRSKVALVDGTRHHLLLRRYFEIPACGTLAAGELPEDYPDRLDAMIAPISPRASDAEIQAQIRAAIEYAEHSEAKLETMARAMLETESVDARARVLGDELVRRAPRERAEAEVD